MNRRDFLKSCTAAASVAALSACSAAGDKKADEEGEMTYRTDPKTGNNVSLLGFGCMRWPEIKDHETGKSVPDQEAANRLVDEAIAAGVNYFDTAPVYSGGLNETVTGKALARHPRDKWTIATKLSNSSRSTWSRDASMNLYRNSFERLQVDTIDYYLLHAAGDRRGGEDFKMRFEDNGMMDFLLEEREKGHIGHLGLSFHGSRKAFDHIMAMHGKYHWDFVQIQMNYMDWKHAGRMNPIMCDASYLYGRLYELGIPVTVMEPLLGGQLANLPSIHAELLAEMDPQSTPASWAFRFCGSHPGVLTVLSGMTYVEHLQENLRTFSPLKALDDKEFELLERIAAMEAEFPTIPCTGCSYCMPCPYGLDIPALLKHYNRCVVNKSSLPIKDFEKEYAKYRRLFLSYYDKSANPRHQADKCIDCGQCTPKCPQGIDIPMRLRKLDILSEKLRRGEPVAEEITLTCSSAVK